MAIIYNYEVSTEPKLGDLLIGTDTNSGGKPTKTFSIASLVGLVGTNVPGGGTVTSISTTATSFISMMGGTITTSGSLSASLSATGTPSASNFLRGDNVWAAPTAGTNTTYSISAVQNGLNNNIRLTGSDTSQTIVSLIAGANIVLTNNGASGITIGVTGLPSGTVTSVTADGGLYIVSGSATVNPVLSVDLTGLNNYIRFSEVQTTAISDDFIAFNQNSSDNVKTTTLGAITPSALSLVKDYIDAGDVGDVRNDADTFTTSAAIEQMVSLTAAEYAGIATKDANTLYVIVGAATTYTTTLGFTNTISGTQYTITGDQAGLTKTGIAGASYAYSSSVVPNSGYYFSSGPSVVNAAGAFSATETVNTTLSGTVTVIDVPPITATLSVSTGGVQGSQFTLGGDLTGATQSGPSPLTYAFATTITPAAGYEFTSGPTVSNASGTINGSQTVVTSITGVLEQTAPPPVTVTSSLVNNLTGFASQVVIFTSPGSFSGNSPVAYNFTLNYSYDETNYMIENLSFTGDINGSATSSKTAVIYATGNVIAVSNPAVVNLSLSNTISGASNGYTLGGDLNGAQQSGATPFAYGFNTTVTLASGYEWMGGTAPTISNAAGTTPTAGQQTVTTTISGATVQQSVQPVTATLGVTYNISGEQVWSPSGYLTGETQSGPPTFNYDFSSSTPSITVPAGYGFSSGPTTTGNIAGQISVDTSIPITVTATVVAEPTYNYYAVRGCPNSFYENRDMFIRTYSTLPDANGNPSSSSTISWNGQSFYAYATLTEAQWNTGSGDLASITYSGSVSAGCPAAPTGTVNLAFTNNVTGGNFTTSLTPGASITGNVGDAYSFVHTITADSGYAFDSGPTWTPSATISGTIPSGTTTIAQSVTGNVVVAPSCTSYIVTNEGGSTGSFTYERCNNGNIIDVTLAPNVSSATFCARNNSIIMPNTFTETEYGPC